MRTFTDSVLIYINSLDRLNGTTSDFQYAFTDIDFTKYNRVTLTKANIPKSYYIVNNNNNIFVLTENGTPRTITVPIGNYTRTSFRLTLITLLNTSAPIDYTYNITQDNITTGNDTGKYTYLLSHTTTAQTPTFTFTSTSLYEQMGFDVGVSTFSVTGSLTSALVSTNVINMAQENTVFLKSNIVLSQNETNVLQFFISSDVGSFGIIKYENQDPITNSKPLSSTSDKVFHFYLQNELGQDIDLNGLSFQFSILLFKENDIDDIVRKAIKYIVYNN